MSQSTVGQTGVHSLSALIEARASETPGRRALTFVDGESQLDLSYAEFARHAGSFALELSAETRVGDRVLLLYQPGPAYVIALLGCALAGVIAVPLYPPPAHRTLERMHAIVRDAGATLALMDRALLDRLAGKDDPLLRGLRLRTFDAFGTTTGRLRAAGGADDVALLQYTSGSTGTPKGVMVSHRNILANAAIVKQAFELTTDDVSVSWLPPYHDMGLIGSIVTPLATGFPAVLMTPLAFLRRPLSWLNTISRVRGTVAGAPNFAYALCAQKLTPERARNLDLSTWRVAFTGAEPIRAATLRDFATAFAPFGFRATSFYPCYGLAEATLMVSGLRGGSSPVTVAADTAALAAGRFVAVTTSPSQIVVGCGQPPAGVLAVIVQPDTHERLPDGTIGEIWVRGPSNARGYWGRLDTDATFSATLCDGDGPYLRTGDLGFRLERELFVTGRRKEVIIVNGRNLYPRDIEEVACAAHSALNPDNGAAFPVTIHAQEQVVFAAELRSTDPAVGLAAAAAVRAALLREMDVALYDVHFVRPGAIPRTSSGKIRRLAMRDEYIAEALARP